MTIRADKLKVLYLIIIMISIFMMHVQYLIFTIRTSLTLFSSNIEEAHFERTRRYHLIPWSIYFILNTCPMLVCTTSTARLFMESS